MKRSREVTIIVNSLVDNQLIAENQTDRARYVIKEAIKDIRRERYVEKRKVIKNEEGKQVIGSKSS